MAELLGYRLEGNASNDGTFFEAPLHYGILCKECGTCLDYSYAPRSMKIHPSKKYDISYTHDLRTLYSERFVNFCRESLRCHDEFRRIRSGHFDYFYLLPKQVVRFDAERRGTRFIEKCSLCTGFREVIGAKPIYLAEPHPLGPGFHRTDLSFADGESKHFLTLISTEWASIIKQQKFRGVWLDPISA